tara:strand:+ start:796 stop:1512 length:717 start_codon:yes stop_codon:yes gene_type:complete
MSVVGLAIGVASSLFGGRKARRAAKNARNKAKDARERLAALELRRQDVINPYDNVTSLAGMATDLSNMLSNPMANLGVATQAAEIQIEESDIALANTLDTLRATGSGAGGATALAQAALKSKKEVSANIEQQEAQNEKLRAEGEANLQTQQMNQAQRLQDIAISEGGREQNAQAQGEAFRFNAQEGRDMQKLNRVQGEINNANQLAAQSSGAETAAWMGLANTAVSAFGGAGLPDDGK